MPARNQINRLDIRSQLLRRDRADPTLPLLELISHMIAVLRVHLKLQLNHIPQSLDAAAQDLLAVGLGADTLCFLAGEEELENGVFVVQITDAIGDNGAFEGFVRERTGGPEVFLDFALGFFYLRRAGVSSGFAHEFAASRDAGQRT